MWQRIIIESLKAAAVLFSDLEENEKRKRLLEMAMDLWENIDPTPDLDLDDEIVEIIMAHVIDWIVEKTDELIEHVN